MEIWRIYHQDLIDGLHSHSGLTNRLMARSTIRPVFLVIRLLYVLCFSDLPTVRLMEV